MKTPILNIFIIIVAFLISACTTYSPPLTKSSSNEECLGVVLVGDTVLLDASQRYDSNDQLSYLWTIKSKPTKSLAEIDFPTHADPTFSADVEGEYVIELVVTNKFGEAQSPAISYFRTSPPYSNTCELGEKEVSDTVGLAALVIFVILIIVVLPGFVTIG